MENKDIYLAFQKFNISSDKKKYAYNTKSKNQTVNCKQTE